MDKRMIGVIATLITVLICGFPGVICMCTGIFFALVSFIPNAKIDLLGRHGPGAALTFGVVTIIIGIVFVAIPAISAGVTWHRNKAAPPSSD